jgi:hypothetical protein
MSNFYFLRGNQKFGPVSAAQLKQLAAQGKLGPTDKVSVEGTGEWVQAGTIKSLFATATPQMPDDPLGFLNEAAPGISATQPPKTRGQGIPKDDSFLDELVSSPPGPGALPQPTVGQSRGQALSKGKKLLLIGIPAAVLLTAGIILAFVVGMVWNGRPLPIIKETHSSFQKIVFTDPQNGGAITLISETECEIARGGDSISLAKYSREDNKFRVVLQSSVWYLDIAPDGLRDPSGIIYLTPEAIITFRDCKDVLTKVHELLGRKDFTGLPSMTPPAYRSTFREILQGQLPVRQHSAKVAGLMDAKIGRDAGAGLEMLASGQNMDPLRGASRDHGPVDWKMVEIKAIDPTHMQVGVKNDFGHFVRTCFLLKDGGAWFWLFAETSDESPEKMKERWVKDLAEVIKIEAALKDIEAGLNDGTITMANWKQRVQECLARQGIN